MKISRRIKYIVFTILAAAISCNSDKSINFTVDPQPDIPLIHDDDPAWSPDGRFIAYTHYAMTFEELAVYPMYQVWLFDMDADTSYRFLYPAMGPRWTQDNTMLAFVGGPAGNIYYYDFATDTILRITNDGYHGIYDWAPDGHAIVTNSGPAAEYGLWTIGLGGLYNRSITPGRPAGDTPRWSRHSGRILYNRAGDGHYYQFGVSDSFGNFLGLVHPTSWNQYQACWGPEDTVVAVTNGMESDFHYRSTRIFFANRRSGAMDFFTLGWSPDFSHDGRQLAFADRSEDPIRFTIWIMGLDGTGKREISRRNYAPADTVAALGAYPRCVLPDAVKTRIRAQ
jgi:Tol biopolymer transport system component